MITRCATLLISGLCVACSAFADSAQNGASVDDPDAYAVYASLLPNEWTVTVAHARRLLFQRETTTNRECMPSGGLLETGWKPVLDNFRRENARVRRLRSGFPLGIAYDVAPAAEIKASFHAVAGDPDFGWTGFTARYPDAGHSIMVASAVGFDPEKRQAIVYMAHSCGSLCGGGKYHYLEKVAGSWRETTLSGVTGCDWES